MKKLTTLLLLSLLFFNCISQQTSPTPVLTKQANYQQRSRNQKIGAILLLGGGGLSAGIGGLIWWAADFEHGLTPGSDPDQRQQNVNTGKVFIIVGSIMMLASIPLFNASNKNKTMSISFKNQLIPQLQNNGFVYRAIPSFNVKISI